MKAKIVDLRYRTKDVLASLERGESVEITSHGKLKGVIEPVKSSDSKKSMRVQEHPMFGCQIKQSASQSVEQEIDDLRQARYRS